VVCLTVVVAFIVRPSDLLLAAVGFGGAGLIVASLAQNHELLWVKLIPALYLPFHIGTALLGALVRSMTGTEASIRSEPPPTTAIVPLTMVVAALVGGYVAVSIKARRSRADDRQVSPAS
jgi:carbon starvation protein CstA